MNTNNTIMRKIVFLSLIAMSVAAVSFAQDAKELAKQQMELNKINKKMLSAKPTKEAKKEAKRLAKEGWVVPAGEKSIELQLTQSLMYGEELMVDEAGAPTKRYIMHTAIATSGTYNAGYAASRTNAMVEVAAILKSEIAAAMQVKIDNDQSSGINALTLDKFNERAKSVVDQCLTNAIPVIRVYRRLSNGNFEVQVRLAFDKKEIAARIKRKMLAEMEKEGDEMNKVVDEVLNSKL